MAETMVAMASEKEALAWRQWKQKWWRVVAMETEVAAVET
jgi:hypothetical protein